jgi:hypothetical protein
MRYHMTKIKTKIRRGKDKKMTTPKAICCNASVPVMAKSPIFNGTFLPPKEPTFWETDIQVIKTCGAISQKVIVYIAPKAKQKIGLLMRKFAKMEWLAYLVGNKNTNVIEDIVIPKQRVSVVKVNVDGQVNVPIMGVIHSHHDMGNKFSHTDDEFINQNHDISLCISHNGIHGQVRVKTECNRYVLVEAVVVDSITEFDTVEFLKDVDTLITEETFFPGYYGKTGMGMGFDFSGDEEDIPLTSSKALSKALSRSVDRELLEEISAYEDSIKGVSIDDFYRVEFEMLSKYIQSLGTPMQDYYEEIAFNDTNNVYTEDYYRLIDEISVYGSEISELERVAINKLCAKLEKMLEVTN